MSIEFSLAGGCGLGVAVGIVAGEIKDLRMDRIGS
jgi:hypothetical protein